MKIESKVKGDTITITAQLDNHDPAQMKRIAEQLSREAIIILGDLLKENEPVWKVQPDAPTNAT